MGHCSIDGVVITKRSDASTAIWPFGYTHHGFEIVECADGQKYVIIADLLNSLEA